MAINRNAYLTSSLGTHGIRCSVRECKGVVVSHDSPRHTGPVVGVVAVDQPDLIPESVVRRLGDGVHGTVSHDPVRLRGVSREHLRTGKRRRGNKPEGFMEVLSLVREHR